jgi:predicted type IV restriction endonuclease
MSQLNLPSFDCKTRHNAAGKMEIFDPVRRKYVVLTPEEEVRQGIINLLITVKGFPASLMAVEKGLKLNGLQKRTDIVQYNQQGIPVVIVECKAPHIPIDEKTFAQAAMYNMTMKVDYLIMSNGHTHIVCKIDYDAHKLIYLNDIPNYSSL